MDVGEIVEKIEKEYDDLDQVKWYHVCLMLLSKAQY